MADRIKGITIEIGGDTTKLQKALADSNKGIRTTQSALRDVNKLLKLDPGNATLLTQKQKELSKAVDSTRDKLQKLRTASEQAAATAKNYDAWKAAYDPIQKELLETQTKAQDLKKQMKELEDVGKLDTDAYKKLQSELDTTQQHAKELRAEAKRVSDEFGNPISPEQFDSLQREIIETEQDLKGLEKQFRDFGSVAGQKMQVVGDKVKAVGEKITAVGGTLTKYVTAPVAAVLTPATKAAIEYGDAIAKVATIADTSVVSVAELHDEILQLSNDTGKKAAELAEATYQAISGGVETANAVNFVAVSTNLAKAGFLETAGAVDVLTTIINAYKRSTEDAALISDQLVETQNKGKTTVQELAANIGTVIPTAAALNVPLDQLLTAYIGLTKNGVNTANATTFINSTLGELAKSGSDVSNILKEKTGKSFGQLLADGKTLCDVLEILGTQVNDDGEAFLNLWGNARAGRGALSLANAGAVEFADTLTGVQNATGNVSGALEALNTPGAKARKALNKISNAAIRMGDVVAPTLEKGAELIEKLADKWDSLSPKTQETIVKGMAVAAVVGPAVTIVGKLVTGVGSVIVVTGVLAAALPILLPIIGSIAAAAAPFLIGGAIVAGVVAGVVWVVKHWDELKEAAGQIKDAVVAKWNGLKEDTAAAWDNIKTKTGELKNSVVEKWESVKSGISDKLTGTLSTVREKTEAIRKAFVDKLNAARDGVQKAIDKIKSFFDFTWSLPKIKLPHFNITGSFSFNPPSTPKLSVDWYAKAMENGMILNHPTIFGAMGGKLLGGGERGAEAVIGVGSLRRIVRESVQQAESNRIVNNYFSFTISGDVKNGKQLYREFKRELQKDVDMRGATWA